jgi:hypothetical protein
MIAIDVVIFAALFAYKISFHYPNHEYLHLLVTYHFGFAKRALIGSILSLFVAKVPVSAVYILGLAAWLSAAGLFILAFRRIFSFDRRNIPLFAFMFGSPLFLKNFMYSIGYFDIYGCIVGFAALLIPIGPIYPFVIGAACVLLILVHHLHFLLYIPTICLIAFVRYYWLSDRSPFKAACGLAFVLIFGMTFVAAAFFGVVPVPRETLIAYVQQRATDEIIPVGVSMWYATIHDELAATSAVFFRNAWRIPIFLAVIALHFPVIVWSRSMIASLAGPDRKMFALGIGGITLGYLVIGIVVFDYSRWVANWGVCMLLVMHALRLMPSTSTIDDAPIAHDRTSNLVLGSIVTLIPRLGIAKPF